MPAESVYRTKQGFSIPMKNWLKAELRPLLDDSPAPGTSRTASSTPDHPALVDEHLQNRATTPHILGR